MERGLLLLYNFYVKHHGIQETYFIIQKKERQETTEAY